MKLQFPLCKMSTHKGDTVSYAWRTPDGLVDLMPWLGTTIRLEATGKILCQGCGKETAEAIGEGFCRNCFFTLAQCDRCITSPELCSYHQGGCREPEWGKQHCLIPHTVYLSLTSGVKVGITRSHQRLTRWMDQGAVSAIPILQVTERLASGIFERRLAQIFPDRTDWRAMLKGNPQPQDMDESRKRALAHLGNEADAWIAANARPVEFHYPVLQYPQTVKALSFAAGLKSIEGTLLGIKGQYLIFDTGVFAVRRHAGYETIINL